MLKIYNVDSYVSINGAKWCRVGNTGYCASSEDLCEDLIIDNLGFAATYKFLFQHHPDGLWLDTTLFGHRPVICISYFRAEGAVRYKNFYSFSYKVVYKEWSDVTLNWIMNRLSADDAIQYMKDRGMAVCPVLKGE